MHKKLLTLFTTAAVAAMTATAAVEAPTAAWGNWFDGTTTAGDNAIDLTADASGNLYFLNTIATMDSAPDAFYAGQKIFTGALGSKQSNSLDLTKTDAAGNAVWTIYTSMGDCDSSQGGLSVSAAGDVYFLCKIRHTDTSLDKAVTFVDATGAAHTVGEAAVSDNYYFLVLGKASANGAIEWLKTITASTTPVVNNGKDFIANAVYVRGLALDNDNNIFIGGNYRTALTFTNADVEGATITPRNVSAWNGDPQGSVGDMFIAKFSSDGSFVASLTGQGASQQYEQVMGLTAANGMIYVNGAVTPVADGTPSVTLAGKSFPLGSVITPFVGAIDPATMTAAWMTSLQSNPVDNKAAYQNPTVNVIGDKLWLTAQGNGNYLASSGSVFFMTTQGTLREGLLVRFDANTGTVEHGVNSRAGFDGLQATALTVFCGVMQNPDAPQDIYVYGSGLNAAVGAYVRKYDAATLTADPDVVWTVMAPQDKGLATCANMVYNPAAGVMVATSRCNKSILPLGGAVSPAPSAWAIYAASYALPDVLVSGIDTVEAPAADITVGKGSLTVAGDKAATVAVYDIAGRTVTNVSVTPGNAATVSLAPGIYIAAGRKLMVR